MRWAFDPAQGKCITFSYGGCKGNGNQFYSEKECKEYCGAPPLTGTPSPPTPRCAVPGEPGRQPAPSPALPWVGRSGSAWGWDRAVLGLG